MTHPHSHRNPWQSLLLPAVAVPAAALAYRGFKILQSDKDDLRMRSSRGVASLEKIKLGGFEQWMLMRGMNVDNPVLLFLHGGPGQPLMPPQSRLRELEAYYTVVHWDQRGAGKSFSPDIPVESMTPHQLEEDARELIGYLRARFNQEKIYLVGHSWGSVLGLRLAARHPDLIAGYVGVGQVVNMREGERLSRYFALARAEQLGNKTAIQQLMDMGPPPYRTYKDMLVERNWVKAFGGYFHKRRHGEWAIYHDTWTSPHYEFAELSKLNAGMHFSCEWLWYPLYKGTDFFSEIPRVEVPVYFLQGWYDFVTHGDLLSRYYEALQAPRGKDLVWFEDSAHWPLLEQPRKFMDILWALRGWRNWAPAEEEAVPVKLSSY